MKKIKIVLSVVLAAMLLLGCNLFASAECAHEYDATFVPPTCNERGYTEYVCKLCGNRIQEGFVDAIGHIYGEWQEITVANCQQNGLQKRTCRVCTGVETRTIPMTDHVDANNDSSCDNCDYVFEKEDKDELSPYEWLKLFFRNLIAWIKAIFA